MSHPAGFFSYVRFNDQIEEGRLSDFREKLENEVSMLLGEKFDLFQDTKGVGFGQNWQRRLKEGLAESTLFIPILTPAYLRRPACRGELEQFLAKEKELGRDDLVLPLLYLETPAVTDEARRIQDPLAIALHEHQYRDWTDLRFEAWEKSKFLRLNAMAKEIVTALERKPPRPSVIKKGLAKTTSGAIEGAEGGSEMNSVAQSLATTSTAETEQAITRDKRAEPVTLIVDPMPGRGDYTSIGAAIAAAAGGERILIRPHVYGEALKVDKPLELIGDGQREQIIIESRGSHPIFFQTSFGRVANLTIRQLGGEGWFGVNIPQGQLVLEDCDITSESLACVGIHKAANPILRRNRIHSGKQSGIFLFENGRGTLEDNDVFGNGFSGVEIKTGADPVLRRNRIHDGKQSGVMVGEKAKGVLEDNDIFGNGFSGVEIKTGGDPVLRRNRIHDGKQCGVKVFKEGKGVLEDNDILANGLSGVEIGTGANPVLRRNRIHDGKQCGVMVLEEGKGVLEDNDIFGNAFAGVEIRDLGSPTLRRNRIMKNREAIRVRSNGTGNFQNNDLRDNQGGGWDIEGAGADLVQEGNIET